MMQIMKSRCFGFIRMIFYCLELLCVFKNAIGEITVPPNDEEAVVSQTVIFKCRSNIKTQFPVAWNYLQLGRNTYNELLYEKGYFSNGNGRRKYWISGNTSDGEFNLVIPNVTLEDAGRYTCVDTDRSERRAELIVYESYPNIPSCLTNQPSDGLVGVNDCGIAPDTLRSSCNVSYRGNLQPVLEWKQGSENLSSAVIKSDTSIMSSIELRADEIRSSAFQCKVGYSNSNIKSKFIWQTTVRILDTKTKSYNASCKENPIQPVDCAFATLHQCSYMWSKSNSNSSFSGSILNLTSDDEAAVYTCHAECLVRQTNCRFTPAQVAFTCDVHDKEGTNVAIIIVVILVVCAIIAVIVVIVVLIMRRRRNAETAASPEETIQLPTSA